MFYCLWKRVYCQCLPLCSTVFYVCFFLHVDLPTAVETGKLNLFLPVALFEKGASVAWSCLRHW